MVVVAVVAVLLLTKHKGTDNPGGGDGGITPTTGVFSFHIDPPQPLTTSPTANQDKAAKAAKPAAQAAEKLIHDFYVNAYLNTGAWTDGAFTGVFDGFSPGAKAQAMKQLNVLTAGTAAADTYNAITENNAHLKEKVLMDLNGQPYSVVAVVTFSAVADLKNGTSQKLISQGQFILEKVGSGWQVTSYSVTRSDQRATASGGGTTTPTAVAS